MRYNCGPIGMPVPVAGDYIVRPAINFLLGMGRNARKIYLTPDDCTKVMDVRLNFGVNILKESTVVDFIHGESSLVV